MGQGSALPMYLFLKQDFPYKKSPAEFQVIDAFVYYIVYFHFIQNTIQDKELSDIYVHDRKA